VQHIQWTGEKDLGYSGLLGRIDLFEINLSDREGDPRPWRLMSKLPIRAAILGFESLEKAREHAEKVMTGFLDNIGAQWKED
jgi:hypothetical protein